MKYLTPINLILIVGMYNMKIAVTGTGYVGLSITILLAQYHETMTVDIIEEK